jgi:hypothetical protein
MTPRVRKQSLFRVLTRPQKPSLVPPSLPPSLRT